MSADFQATGEVKKVDESLGLVFGWAVITKINGEPYFDLQGHHIPDESMVKAATDFMLNSRIALEMHHGEPIGSVVFSMPLSEDVAKAFGLKSDTYGWMVAMRPAKDVFDKFKDGTYTGFSIGGKWDELVDA